MMTSEKVVYAEMVPPYGEWLNESVFSAVQEFRSRGYKVIPFEYETKFLSPKVSPLHYHVTDLTSETPVIGSVGAVRWALQNQFGVSPDLSSYPPRLRGFLGREVCQVSLGEFLAKPEEDILGKFVKPVEQKLFAGKVLTTTKDLLDLTDLPSDTQVWVSKDHPFLLEVRMFFLRGKVLDVRPYKGDTSYLSSLSFLIKKVAEYWEEAPSAYVLDVGVTPNRFTDLVEVNDAFAFDSYGLRGSHYADMLQARWAELTRDKGPRV